MNTLIIKLNATGDVVRTTCLLRRLEGSVTWVTAASNVTLLQGLERDLRCLAWEDRDAALDQHYDLLINLEDDPEPADFARRARHARLFGAFLDGRGAMAYTENACGWFDLSLISVHGRKQADHLKLLNRRTYQDLIFEGLGFEFRNEAYLLPAPAGTDLSGDVAIAPVAGPVWPMKNWAHYAGLQRELTAAGLRVNVLPRRATLQEHMGDVRNHRCLVGGDSLPMHLALGLRVPCVTLFNCTSPWEIHDYGYQTKIVSPLLAEFFYKRGMDERAIHAIGVDEVLNAVWQRLARPSHAPEAARK